MLLLYIQQEVSGAGKSRSFHRSLLDANRAGTARAIASYRTDRRSRLASCCMSPSKRGAGSPHGGTSGDKRILVIPIEQMLQTRYASRAELCLIDSSSRYAKSTDLEARDLDSASTPRWRSVIGMPAALKASRQPRLVALTTKGETTFCSSGQRSNCTVLASELSVNGY